jgi:hypothetical protein
VEMIDQKRLIVEQLLFEQRLALPRPARQFLDGLLVDPSLLARMAFCRGEERSHLRNSVLISAEDGGTWAVMLGNDPSGGRPAALERSRLALEGLGLTHAEVLERLASCPIWFLAVDQPYADPPPGKAMALERGAHQLAGLPIDRMRRRALLDQIDAALDDGDRAAFERLHRLLDRK